MTTLIQSRGRTNSQVSVLSYDVFGARWPLYKVHALLLGVIAAPTVWMLTGSGQIAAWIAGALVLAVWWGERALVATPVRTGSRAG